MGVPQERPHTPLSWGLFPGVEITSLFLWISVSCAVESTIWMDWTRTCPVQELWWVTWIDDDGRNPTDKPSWRGYWPGKIGEDYSETPNTGQLNPLFQTFAEFRPIVNRVVARQSTDWLAGSAQFSPNEFGKIIVYVIVKDLGLVDYQK